jgi:hypothetical protein
MTSTDGITWTIRPSAADYTWNSVIYGDGLFVAVSNSGTGNLVMTSGVIGLAARVAAAAEAARVAAAAEAAKKAKEQKELLEILGVIPSIAGISVNIGDLTNSLLSTKCTKGKTIKYVKKSAKCPKGFVKRK